MVQPLILRLIYWPIEALSQTFFFSYSRTKFKTTFTCIFGIPLYIFSNFLTGPHVYKLLYLGKVSLQSGTLFSRLWWSASSKIVVHNRRNYVPIFGNWLYNLREKLSQTLVEFNLRHLSMTSMWVHNRWQLIELAQLTTLTTVTKCPWNFLCICTSSNSQ